MRLVLFLHPTATKSKRQHVTRIPSPKAGGAPITRTYGQLARPVKNFNAKKPLQKSSGATRRQYDPSYSLFRPRTHKHAYIRTRAGFTHTTSTCVLQTCKRLAPTQHVYIRTRVDLTHNLLHLCILANVSRRHVRVDCTPTQCRLGVLRKPKFPHKKPRSGGFGCHERIVGGAVPIPRTSTCATCCCTAAGRNKIRPSPHSLC